jgi:DNA-binding transcriptional MerR regulator
MAASPVEIPDRALFRAGEVCEIAGVQPYVLRSWEAEFPQLGISRGQGGRLYRRQDVERVLEIKRLLFVDGLTLAGVRRRLDEGAAPAGETPGLAELLGEDARRRLVEVRRGLQSILALLSRNGHASVPAVPQQASLIEEPTPDRSGRTSRSERPRASRRDRQTGRSRKPAGF